MTENKIQFFVGYPDDKHYTLTINYKDGNKLKNVLSITIAKPESNTSLNDALKTNAVFSNFKQIYNHLKLFNSQKNFKMKIDISNQVEITELDNDTDNKKKTEANQKLNFLLGEITDSSAIKGIKGGAKPRKQSNSTSKRRKKRSSKTRRL